MHTRALILAVATAISGLAMAGAAAAEPYAAGGYPAFANEGAYPEQTPCSYRLQQSKRVGYRGQTITLKLFYNGRCGAFGRIDNAPQGCSVTVWRTDEAASTAALADQSPVGSITEPVDPGISYAYTQVVNNLQARSARAMVACGGGPVLASTDWY